MIQKVTSDKMAEIYTIPLRGVYELPRPNRAKKAVRIVKEFLVRHTKSDSIKLDPSISEAIWARGIEKPPRRVKVKVTEEEGKVTATLTE